MIEYDFAVSDLQKKLSNIIRIGVVEEVDYKSARVRVKTGEIVTNWLPWVTSRAGENNIWNPPDVGEQVVILSPSGELSLGVILPAIYQQKYPALENKKETNSIVFQDGTRFSYNSRNRHFEICVIEESRPAELPHQSLAELCMNFSAHTAPII